MEGSPMGGIIGTLVIGLVAGIIAKLLMPGKDPGGFIITILLAIGWYGEGEQARFIGAVVGAVIILIIYRLVRRRSAT
jgi:uncharacterized membrane protein YeaQ/YmgE (transglycosylase-associated protein family)